MALAPTVPVAPSGPLTASVRNPGHCWVHHAGIGSGGRARDAARARKPGPGIAADGPFLVGSCPDAVALSSSFHERPRPRRLRIYRQRASFTARTASLATARTDAELLSGLPCHVFPTSPHGSGRSSRTNPQLAVSILEGKGVLMPPWRGRVTPELGQGPGRLRADLRSSRADGLGDSDHRIRQSVQTASEAMGRAELPGPGPVSPLIGTTRSGNC